ncbi:MAG: DUF1573 domain-containing protein [Crocinitomicaceae bacterium]|nr:DUF1573 domain-containing protein [Crocinitomicaceae bacterium]MBT6030017.1 DUF1573 domain-containing protein [Crocinitomicaceae bacterium]
MFEQPIHKFPKTKAGTLLEHDYIFTNIGDKPLIISKIEVSCACTQYSFSTKPVAPGKKGVIHMSFDTKNKFDFQNRVLSVFSNTNKSPIKIKFKVLIINE